MNLKGNENYFDLGGSSWQGFELSGVNCNSAPVHTDQHPADGQQSNCECESADTHSAGVSVSSPVLQHRDLGRS